MLFDSIGINFHIGIGNDFIKIIHIYLWLMLRNFCMIKEIWNRRNQGFNYFKDTM